MASRTFLDRFSRGTTSGRFIPEIDGLRFVSIGYIFLFHLAGFVAMRSPGAFETAPSATLLGRLVAHGEGAVHLFFAISGFLLALPFAAHYLKGARAVGLRAYYVRRVTRIEPPYVVSLYLIFALLVLVEHESGRALLPHLLASTFYLHNAVFSEGSRINFVAWTLEIEVQFYLLAPLISALIFRVRDTARRRALIAAVALAAGLLRWLAIPDGSRLSLSLIAFLQYFMVGFMLADLYLAAQERGIAGGWAWDLAWLGAVGAFYVVYPVPALHAVLWPAVLLLIMWSTFRGVAVRRVLTNRWITTIGGMCYTIYLFHFQTIAGVGRATIGWRVSNEFWVNYLVQLACIVPPLLALTAAFFLLVERPCMERDWPQRLWARLARRRRRAPAMVTEGAVVVEAAVE